MMIGPDVLQSINGNGIDVGTSWLFCPDNVFDESYLQVLSQPISVDLTTLTYLRWKVPSTTVVLRASTSVSSAVVWAGAIDTIPDSTGSSSGSGITSIALLGDATGTYAGGNINTSVVRILGSNLPALSTSGVLQNLSGVLTWVSSVPPGGSVGGDLSGTLPNPSVTGILTKVLPSLPVSTANLTYTGSAWVFDTTTYLSTAAAASTYAPIAGDTSLITLGTVTTGTWHGTVVDVVHGGTGQSTWSQYSVVYAGTTTQLTGLAANTTTATQFLTSTGTGSAGTAPVWSTLTTAMISNLGSWPGSTSITTLGTISTGTVPLANLATQATATLVGNNSGSTAAPTALSVATVQTMLGIGGGPFIPLTGSGSVTGAIVSTSTFQGTKFITTGSSSSYFVLGDGTTVLTSTYATTSSLGSYLLLAGGVLTGNLKLATGTTTVAPLSFVAGTNLTTAVAGAVEYDGSRVYVTTTGPTRNTVAYVSDIPATATVLPLINGTAALGGQGKWSDGGHVHPTDTSRAPVASPTFTGTVTTPALTVSGFTVAGALKTNASGVISSTAGTSTQFVKADGSVDSSAYITGNQTITLTGAVTGTGTTAIATTYGSIAAGSVIANITGSAAVPVAVAAVSTATASSFAVRDSNANITATNFIEGYTTTAMSGTTTTLVVSSTYLQYFTGTSTTSQTVQLPVVSLLVLGQQFSITNASTGTGTITIQSSGTNTVVVLQPSTSAIVTCILVTGATAASWSYSVYPVLGTVAVTGTGTINTLPKWSNSTGGLGNSSVTDTGSLVTVTNPLTVTGTTTLAMSLSGTLIGTSGVVSALSGTNIVLGNGTTTPQSTFATNVTTTTGDMIYTSSSGTPGTLARLPIGTSAQVLIGGTTPSWSSVTGITGVGTVTAGTWTATTIGTTYGGTGQTVWLQYSVPYAASGAQLVGLAPNTSAVQMVFAMTGTGSLGTAPIWTSTPTFTGLTLSSPITLTGAVTASITGTGSFATAYGTIAANSVIANTTGSVAVPVATSLLATATASSVALRDVNANLTAVNHIEGYATTVTSVSTVTLTVGSPFLQYFTGSTAQTVMLPSTSTLVLGMQWQITNNATTTVSVQTSTAVAVVSVLAGTTAVLTCISTSVNTAAAWSYVVSPNSGSVTGTGVVNALPKWSNTTGALTNSSVSDTGSLVTVSNSLTVTGTTTLSASLTGVLIGTSGSVSSLTGTNIVLGNGTTITQASVNPTTTIGDLIYASATATPGTLSRLAVGTSAQVLIGGTTPSWSSVTGITGTGTITAGTWNATTIAVAHGGTGLTSLGTVGTAILPYTSASSGNLTWSGSALGVDTTAYLSVATAASTYLTIATAGTTYQPLNAKLTSISALANASGALTNNGSGTFSYVSYLTTISGITAGGDLSGAYPNPTVTRVNGITVSAWGTAGALIYNGTTLASSAGTSAQYVLGNGTMTTAGTGTKFMLDNGSTVTTATYATAASINIGNTYVAYGNGTGIVGSSSMTWNGTSLVIAGDVEGTNIATDANSNTVVGYAISRSGFGSNSVVGYAAGHSLGSSAGYNTIMGAQAGYSIVNGSENTLIGVYAGQTLSGSYNLMLGAYAGFNQVTATSNTLIIDAYSNRGSSALELSNSLIVGTFASTPSAQTLRINAGTITLSQLATNGYVTVTGGVLSSVSASTLTTALGGPFLPLAGGTITPNNFIHFDQTTGVYNALAGGITGLVGDNDYWRIAGGNTGTNNGYLELATADDGTEPIYVRQYTGVFVTLQRTLTLLDGSGNTSIPGALAVAGTITSNAGQLTTGSIIAGKAAMGTYANDANSAWYGITGNNLGPATWAGLVFAFGNTYISSPSTGSIYLGNVAGNVPVNITGTLSATGTITSNATSGAISAPNGGIIAGSSGTNVGYVQAVGAGSSVTNSAGSGPYIGVQNTTNIGWIQQLNASNTWDIYNLTGSGWGSRVAWWSPGGALTATGTITSTSAWSGGQVILGSSGQSGLIAYKRGSDGANAAAVGYASASTAGDFQIYSGGGAGTIRFSVNAGDVALFDTSKNATFYGNAQVNGAVTVGSLTAGGIVKANTSGTLSIAAAGTDYLTLSNIAMGSNQIVIGTGSNITTTGYIFASGNMDPASYTIPNTAGNWIGWNRQAGHAEFDFVSNAGTSGYAGGFNWYKVNNGAWTGPVMALDGFGNLGSLTSISTGSLTASGIITSTSGNNASGSVIGGLGAIDTWVGSLGTAAWFGLSGQNTGTLYGVSASSYYTDIGASTATRISVGGVTKFNLTSAAITISVPVVAPTVQLGMQSASGTTYTVDATKYYILVPLGLNICTLNLPAASIGLAFCIIIPNPTAQTGLQLHIAAGTLYHQYNTASTGPIAINLWGGSQGMFTYVVSDGTNWYMGASYDAY